MNLHSFLPPGIRAAVLTAMLSFGSCYSLAATYYVDPSGDDATNDGQTLATPWRTIARANAVVQPGDTVLLRGGEYTSPGTPPENTIAPARSGDAGNPITYRAYPGETPVLTDIVTKQPALGLANRAHIVIEGITVDGKALGKASNIKAWGVLEDASHITIRNCTFRYAYAFSGILIHRGGDHRILNNSFDFCGDWDDAPRLDWGENLELRDTTRVLVEGNTFRHGGHNCLSVTYASRFNVIRNNRFNGDWSDVYPLRGTGTVGNRTVAIGGNETGANHNLFERNIVTKTGSAIDMTYPTALKIQGEAQICRFNYIFDNVHEAIRSDTLSDSVATVRNRIYHNVIFNNGGPAWYGRRVNDGVFENRVIDENIFKNNIVHRSALAPNPASANNDAQIYLVPYPADPADPMRRNAVINNSFVRSTPGDARLYLHHDASGATPMTLAFLQSTAPYEGDVIGNIMVAPDFVVDQPNGPDDFRLKPTSGLIDAGAFLTKATNSGTGGRTLIVEDSEYFTNGYGVIEGDFIQIGTRAPVQISAVDYATHTIILADDTSWSAGDPVSLPYDGAAPDIGAWEFFSGPAPDAPVIVSATASSPTTTSLSWNDASTGETAFLLERKVVGEPDFIRVATLPPNITDYQDAGLTHGTTYVYRLAVTTVVAVSSWTEATITTPLPPPAAPVVVQPPASLSVGVGATATFSVSVTGFPAPALQWRKDGAALPGANSATLTLAGTTLADSGVYDLVASNFSGSTTCPPAVLVVNPQGESGKVTLTGSATSASISESGRGPANTVDGDLSTFWNARDNQTPQDGEWIRYDLGSVRTVDLVKVAWENAAARIFTYDLQLSLDGSSWSTLRTKAKSAGTGVLETDDIPNTDARYIRIWSFGSQVSPRFSTVREFEAWTVAASAPPSIVTGPQALTLEPGETGHLTVVATGNPAPEFQWRKNGVPLPDTVGPVLTLTSATLADSGAYDVVVTNPAGSVTSPSVQVIVEDRTPPVLQLPDDISREATGPGGAAVHFVVSANDAIDGPVPIALSAESGATFPLGTTVVTAQAADAAGNTASGSFRVLVQDTTPPVLNVPDDLVVEADRPGGALVHFTLNGTDLATPLPAVASVPTSGSLFPHGETWVYATAVDNSGNTQSGVFSVTVNRSAVSNHAPTLNGQSLVAGSLQVLKAENVTLNGQVVILRDLLVQGQPVVHRNGAGGTPAVTDGGGASAPSSHRITFNGQSDVRRVVRRTDGFTLPPVPPPALPAGTRNINLNQAGQSPGAFATLRNLTLNGNAGEVTVPPGAYGSFTANGNSRFVFGIEGAMEPAHYDLQSLTLNGQSRLVIVGPVILTLAGSTTFNAPAGHPDHPDWLVLRLAAGGLTLNSGADLFALVEAPAGTVTLNGNTGMVGGVVADRLVLNGDATLELTNPPPATLP